jgi:ABC-type transport system involved in multi-copper enzyme maturation permease subunit
VGSLAIARLSIIETLRRKEFYTVLILVVGLAVWLHLIDVGSSGAGRFAKDVVIQIVWLASFALAVPLAARQLPQDAEAKTVYILLARPMARCQYVLGRSLGAMLASGMCLCGFFLVLSIMLSLKGGTALADPTLWQAFALQLVAVSMLSAVAVFFSSFSSSAAAVVFSFMAFAVMRYGAGSMLNMLQGVEGIGRQALWAGYLLLPHFEFFNVTQRFVHEWGPLPAGMFLGIMAYGVLYSIVLIAACSLVFRRRWL